MAERWPFAGSGVGPQPKPTSLTLGIDVSNYSGALSSGQVDDLKKAGYGLVIVQAITGLDGKSYTSQQLATCHGMFMRVQGYVWCFPNETAASVNSRLNMFNGFPLERIWLDVEQAGVTVKDVNLALSLCDLYMGNDTPTGIYSGKWFFDAQKWTNRSFWANRPLWDSNYDGVADPDVNFRPYGGWDRCEIKQFRGTSTVAGIPNVDINVAR